MLPDVKINLGNGNIGSVSLSDDGIAALLLTGAAVGTTLLLNKAYVLSSADDLATLGITAENNPFIYKEVTAFYQSAGDGAELHLMAVSEASTLTQMCAAGSGSPLKSLIDSAAGRIRLVGVNRLTPDSYEPTVDKCIDGDVITAVSAAQSVATEYMGKIAPVVILLPALGWNGETTGIYQPREGSQNCVALVLASDGKFGASKLHSAKVCERCTHLCSRCTLFCNGVRLVVTSHRKQKEK